MNYVPKKHRKSNYFLVVSFLLAMVILIGVAAIYLKRDQAPVDPFSICSSYSADKSRALIASSNRSQTTTISDFSYYGESLGFYRSKYGFNANDWMNGKTVFLTNLCDSKPEQAYILDKSLDGKIPVHQLDVGFYKIEVLDVLDRYQLVSDSVMEASFQTMNRTHGSKTIEIFADAKQTKQEDGLNYVYLKVSYTPSPDHVDIVLDPYGLMRHGNGEIHFGAQAHGVRESDMMFAIAQDVKDTLESHGLKVALARESDEALNVFGDQGRLAQAYEKNGLYYIQLRLPYGWTAQEIGATAMYPGTSSNRMAQSIMSHLAQDTSLPISTWKNRNNRQGVYQTSISDVSEDNDLFRESGGLLTGAGRDSDYGLSLYKDTKHGMQSVIVEYGYVTDQRALEALDKEHDAIVKATAQGILESLGVSQ